MGAHIFIPLPLYLDFLSLKGTPLCGQEGKRKGQSLPSLPVPFFLSHSRYGSSVTKWRCNLWR